MTEKTPAQQGLIQKLVKVAASIRNIEKGGRNTTQGYDYVTEADVVRTVIPALLAEGILFYPAKRRVVGVEPFTTAKGSHQFLTTIEATWVFTDGNDQLEVMTVGQGTDAGDKGVYKGMTGDKKYAILQALGIATGDDPEATSAYEKEEKDPDAKATTAQIGRMFGLAKKAGIDTTDAVGKKILQELVLKATGKHSSKQLTMGDMDTIYKTLEGRAILNQVLEVSGGELLEEVA